MTKVEFLPAARRDLAGIYIFTQRRFGRAQADRYVAEIVHSCALVLAGRRRFRSETATQAGLFSHRAESHRVFHRHRVDGGLIIVRILHGSMNREDHL